MSIGNVEPELARRLPLDRIAELSEQYGVSELSLSGPILEREPGPDDEILFLVRFIDDDSGPWGSKLDQLENDLSGAMHRKVRVASRRGVEQSMPSPWRGRTLGAARLIYERWREAPGPDARVRIHRARTPESTGR